MEKYLKCEADVIEICKGHYSEFSYHNSTQALRGYLADTRQLPHWKNIAVSEVINDLLLVIAKKYFTADVWYNLFSDKMMFDVASNTSSAFNDGVVFNYHYMSELLIGAIAKLDD